MITRLVFPSSFLKLASAKKIVPSVRFYSSHLSLKNKKVQSYIESLIKNPDLMDRGTPIYRVVQEIHSKTLELDELYEMGKENPELKETVEQDATSILSRLAELEKQFFQNIVQPERDDHFDVVMEVSAGVGGQEAMLFTEDLLKMYSSYATFKGWNFELLSSDTTEIGGVRHSSISISGNGVYKLLKFEGGIHRVQRVPKTEKAGRIHTSTSAVAVLPAPSEVDITINPSDLKIETKRASGAGGQHVNKTESAVRIVHIPTGLVVECQTERSQIKNKTNAMKTLRAKLYSQEVEKQNKSIRVARKLQVGVLARSEKIRTYNFVQDRVTDHRIGLTVHNLKEVMQGGEKLEKIVSSLLEYDQMEKINQIFKD